MRLLSQLLLLSCTCRAWFGNRRWNLPRHGGGDATAVEATTEVLESPEAETKESLASFSALTEHIFDKERDGPLEKDINLLNNILSAIVQTEWPRLYDLYTQYRRWGQGRARDLLVDEVDAGAGPDLKAMIQCASELSPKECLGVVRMFSIMLNLINAAEVHHSRRSLPEGGPLPLQQTSIRGTVQDLLQEGHDPRDIFDQVCRQYAEIVLTAHPTQVQRKSLLRKYRRVSELLQTLESSKDYDYDETWQSLETTIISIWGADEIRRLKPTPNQEAAGGLAILESVLWEAVPTYLRKLDWTCQTLLNETLPLDVTPIRFASWIGGDRDGNPNVTPQVTLEVVLEQRLRAARLFLKDMYLLLDELAISSSFSPELKELADTLPASRHAREKYRRIIGHLMARLEQTIHECQAKLQGTEIVSEEGVEAIWDVEELLGPLNTIYDSLVSTGMSLVARGSLTDTIRKLHVFGLSLVPLDIREESTRHTLALDAITRSLGMGSYKEWSEDARLNWLTSELSSKRPLFRMCDVEDMGFDDKVVTTLKVFETISDLHPSSLGAYVISQAQTASDVLAVILLQKQYGMTRENGKLMRVVPLFETLDDLDNAPTTLTKLFGISSYLGMVQSKQEVMVGYSDSAKDAGRLAACWAQYESQEQMVKVAQQFDVELSFFHGKGGTVGRGGNPSVYRAIMSHPPNTINGRFRVTEQGEMIQQNFGAPNVAVRTLDIYTAALCREAFFDHTEPNDEWRRQIKRISEISCDDYRYLVRSEPQFVPYFRQATPELELGSLNIGSRPAKRNPKGGIESLRAIPWTFAWAQTRTHLSAWLGVNEGLTAEGEDLAALRDMYENWSWFREIIDLIAMIVSKTDWSITQNYDHQLVDKSLLNLGDAIREKMVQTRRAVLSVTQSSDVAGVHVALMRASATIRHPYVDPINVVQAELLKRLRSMEGKSLSEVELADQEILKDALVISINGIAQGMRNSG